MRSVSIPEWGEYFQGRNLGGSANRPYRPVPEDMTRWLTYMQQSPTASSVLAATENAIDFFNVEKDLALIVPRNEWVEFFYSMKNGFIAPNCPAQFIYFAKITYAQHKICNLVAPMLPKEVAFYLRKPDYFGAGYTACDAMCNFVNAFYQPITSERPIVKCGDWYEAYIPCTDMVAALPAEIGTVLSADDLYRVTLKPGIGLVLDNKPLATLGGKQGVCKSVYDLRGVI